MNIERMPYSPGEQEHQAAHDSMTEEQELMTAEREKALGDEVVDELITKGEYSHEAMAALIRWQKMKEHEAYLRNSTRAQIEKAIEVARLYKRAGCFQEALEDLKETEDMAASEQDNFELYNKVKDLEDKIREEGGEML